MTRYSLSGKTPVIAVMGGVAAMLLAVGSAFAQPRTPEEILLDLQMQWAKNEQRGVTQLHLRVHADRIRMILCAEGKTDHCPEKRIAGLQAQWHVTDDPTMKQQIHLQAKRLRTSLCMKGDTEHCSVHQQPLVARNVDIDRLAYAVAVAETSNCTTGMGLSRNNCFGIMHWKTGKREGVRYRTKEESFQAFKILWLTKYGDRFPTLSDAQRYSGGPGESWLERVRIAYNRGPQPQQVARGE
jgi:hypothetical protein